MDLILKTVSEKALQVLSFFCRRHSCLCSVLPEQPNPGNFSPLDSDCQLCSRWVPVHLASLESRIAHQADLWPFAHTHVCSLLKQNCVLGNVLVLDPWKCSDLLPSLSGPPMDSQRNSSGLSNW